MPSVDVSLKIYGLDSNALVHMYENQPLSISIHSSLLVVVSDLVDVTNLHNTHVI